MNMEWYWYEDDEDVPDFTNVDPEELEFHEGIPEG